MPEVHEVILFETCLTPAVELLEESWMKFVWRGSLSDHTPFILPPGPRHSHHTSAGNLPDRACHMLAHTTGPGPAAWKLGFSEYLVRHRDAKSTAGE
jgi:hypothetical protein